MIVYVSIYTIHDTRYTIHDVFVYRVPNSGSHISGTHSTCLKRKWRSVSTCSSNSWPARRRRGRTQRTTAEATSGGKRTHAAARTGTRAKQRAQILHDLCHRHCRQRRRLIGATGLHTIPHCCQRRHSNEKFRLDESAASQWRVGSRHSSTAVLHMGEDFPFG